MNIKVSNIVSCINFRKILLTAIFCLATIMLYAFDNYAQTISLDLGTGQLDNSSGATSSAIFRMLLLVTVLGLAPSILMMVTSFTRIIVVLSLVRSAIGIQQTPPNTVLISLALFLTFFIMQPVFEKSYYEGIKPLIEDKIEQDEAFEKIGRPFHEFMMKNAREKDVNMFLNIIEESENTKINIEKPEDVPYKALLPAFMISELHRAFEIGFLIFIPFLIIDMVIASILMSMGMMMLPPVLISLPFKIIFFVLIDGWAVLSESLIKSFYQ